MNVFEVNFDGLIGPTHHYGGLAAGNVPSQQNRSSVSHPRAAALQGLEKMKLLAERGVPQAVLPPHPRPHWEFLKAHGLQGIPEEMIEQAAQTAPDRLSKAYSAAAMWTANAATVSPSPDTVDGRLHLTPANLISNIHRALESEWTTRLLRMIFAEPRHFVVYDPLPPDPLLADEGAANQLRLCRTHEAAGTEVFVYGRDENDPALSRPQKFPARQTRGAAERIAALHGLEASRRFFVQQNPEAIDAGVFHNDVIAVANENVLLCHEQAFVDQPDVLKQLSNSVNDLVVLEIPRTELSLEEAVQTYFFNSQLLTLPNAEPNGDRRMLLLCPEQCESNPRTRQVIDEILAGANPIREARFVDVGESLRNGGGPACLRLRVVLTEEELRCLKGNVLLSERLYEDLKVWINRHYRSSLTLQELGDPRLAEEVRIAQSELSSILQLDCESAIA